MDNLIVDLEVDYTVEVRKEPVPKIVELYVGYCLRCFAFSNAILGSTKWYDRITSIRGCKYNYYSPTGIMRISEEHIPEHFAWSLLEHRGVKFMSGADKALLGVLEDLINKRFLKSEQEIIVEYSKKVDVTSCKI